MASSGSIVIYHINGSFLIFEPAHALLLRRQRLVAQSVGTGLPGVYNGPYFLSPYAAAVIFENGLASFRILKTNIDVSVEKNQSDFSKKIEAIIESEEKLFMDKRLEELEKRNIAKSAETIKHFDSSKLRIEISTSLDKTFSSHSQENLSHEKISLLLYDSAFDTRRACIYRDLYKRGFYVTSGMKFGADFLAYSDDPVRYHAVFAVRYIDSTKDGRVELASLDYRIINSFQRLTHSASKVPLFATVLEEKVMYWTLEERQYLMPTSKADDLKPLDPNPRVANKLRKTCYIEFGYILFNVSIAMIAFPLNTIIPIFSPEAASSKTRFIKGSKPRSIPVTVLDPLSLTETSLSMYFLSSGG